MGIGQDHLSPPTPLGPGHDIESFTCGEGSLDQWLKERALRAGNVRSARTYVVCDAARVVGYYTLHASGLLRASAPKPLQRTMPDPLPVMVLGRLAADRAYQGRGIGQGLLRDAIVRTIELSRQAGVVALVVPALSAEVKRFYLTQEFAASPLDDLTLVLPIRKAIQPFGTH